eukprot:768523-Hanusia_phi.AAC.11
MALVNKAMAGKAAMAGALRSLSSSLPRVSAPYSSASRSLSQRSTIILGSGPTRSSYTGGFQVPWAGQGKRSMSSGSEEKKDLPPLVYEDTFIKSDIESPGNPPKCTHDCNGRGLIKLEPPVLLRHEGFRVIPVNPASHGKKILGEHVYKDLIELSQADVKVDELLCCFTSSDCRACQIDMVDVFRGSEFVVPIAEDAVKIGAKVLWMQLGVRNDEAARIAEAGGLKVVQDRCPKIEFRCGLDSSRHSSAFTVACLTLPVVVCSESSVGMASTPASSRGDDVASALLVSAPDRNAARGDRLELQESASMKAKLPKKMLMAKRCTFSVAGPARVLTSGAAPDPTTGARGTPIYQTTGEDEFCQRCVLVSLKSKSCPSNPDFSLQRLSGTSIRDCRTQQQRCSRSASQTLRCRDRGDSQGLIDPGACRVEEELLAPPPVTQLSSLRFSPSCRLICLVTFLSSSFLLVGSAWRQAGCIEQVVWWKYHSGSDTNDGSFRSLIILAKLGKTIKKFDWNCEFVDVDNLDNVRNAVKIPLIIDNTMATPYLCRPMSVMS